MMRNKNVQKSLILTIANADYLEFLQLEENTHRFLLDGNVSIRRNNLFLPVRKLKFFLPKMVIQRATPIGEVSMMYAFGNVMLQAMDGHHS